MIIHQIAFGDTIFICSYKQINYMSNVSSNYKTFLILGKKSLNTLTKNMNIFK